MSARFCWGLDRAIGAYGSGNNAPKSPLSTYKITARLTMFRSKVMAILLKKFLVKVDFGQKKFFFKNKNNVGIFFEGLGLSYRGV